MPAAMTLASPALAPPPVRRATVGLRDDGRRMTLDDFDRAVGDEGRDYELGRGVVAVVDVPDLPHFRQEDEIRDRFKAHARANPGSIDAIMGTMQCKLLIEPTQSERHPDLAVYTTPRPSGPDVWSRWVPAIAVEVVSASSVRRDYDEKPDDYLLFGVREYLISDRFRRLLTALVRDRGRWVRRELGPDEVYTTDLLPGFELPCRPIFEAADNA